YLSPNSHSNREARSMTMRRWQSSRHRSLPQGAGRSSSASETATIVICNSETAPPRRAACNEARDRLERAEGNLQDNEETGRPRQDSNLRNVWFDYLLDIAVYALIPALLPILASGHAYPQLDTLGQS